ncbi:RNA polymerase sigma factor [Dyadobacter bucti]|uniref:RNA polymerase sigma factor n=1 Tax=Dyadobacter bucti TaxID=2572203 RepID=UPI0011084110|nr:sigma-70 family RNA polymerase sigma factor [Dyadobacter bucti]
MRFLRLLKNKKTEPPAEAEKLLAYRRTGDIRLLGALYEPYMEMVFGICYKYLRQEEESKDAVMQIFEKLVTDLKTHEIDNLKSWLHTVARNFCLMRIRGRRVFEAIDEKQERGDLKYDMNDDEGHSEIEINLKVLEKCMERLVYEQRTSVELFFLREKCYREISDETGFDFNKVKSYIQNGKRNLKICMDKNGSN